MVCHLRTDRQAAKKIARRTQTPRFCKVKISFSTIDTAYSSMVMLGSTMESRDNVKLNSLKRSKLSKSSLANGTQQDLTHKDA